MNLNPGALIGRMGIVTLLSGLGTVAQAQITRLPDFVDRHFQFEASEANDGPRMHTQFNYALNENLTTSSRMKINNNGFEDHMAAGLVQDFGVIRARLSYNLYRYNYIDRDEQKENVSLDLHYGALHMQHRLEDSAEVSRIGLPFNINSVKVELAYSQTLEDGTGDTTDQYSIQSNLNGLKFSASWSYADDNSSSAIHSEFRPARNWLMKISYSENTSEEIRQLRSEYAARHFRLSGEVKRRLDQNEQIYVTGTLGLEKKIHIAQLKLGFNYDGSSEDVVSPYLEVRSELEF